MTDIHTRNKECIEGISESLDKMKTQVARNTTAIVMHDATVRGEGTAHFGTTQDVLDKVLNNGKS